MRARVNLDLSDPTTQALSRYSESSPSGWFVSPVTFALTRADGESGPQRIDYRLDDGDWQTYAGPFTLDQGGQHQ